MDKKEILKQIEDKAFLDKIYQFSYFRCNTSYEAEDLCSDIILAVLSAINRQDQIENFYAFVWSIARRVYADYCKKRSKTVSNISMENVEPSLASKENEIDRFLEETADAAQIKKIFDEIAFLSKIYRDVMVMHYIDGITIKDIALKLGISENAVKQRLFSARRTVKKEVKTMNSRNLSLKPVRFMLLGSGNVCGNDPRIHAKRTFSQNLIYLCKDKARSVKELSDALCVPMPFIEEELLFQCHGENGEYGMLRKLNDGRYAINVFVVDYDEYAQANDIYKKYIKEICRCLKIALEKNKNRILSFPYLSIQDDTKFILWCMLTRTMEKLGNDINNIIQNKYFSNISPIDRSYSFAAIAFQAENEDELSPFDLYGCDGNHATSLGGFKHIFISNLYGKRLGRHFTCGHNISNDKRLLLLLKSIGGLSVDTLSETEKELAAKCIECGYLRKNGDLLEPKIVVIERKNQMEFEEIAHHLQDDLKDVKDKIAEELAVFMKKHIPDHLLNEYHFYNQLIAAPRVFSEVVEACIQEGVLSEPQDQLGAEGVLMIVKKD